jgi:hypothetical protein
VNSANGQGKGAQDQDTAPFAPAHVLGTNQVFHPTKFDLTFTSTSGGQTFSFVDTDTKRNAKTPTECSIDYSITDPDTGTRSRSPATCGASSPRPTRNERRRSNDARGCGRRAPSVGLPSLDRSGVVVGADSRR